MKTQYLDSAWFKKKKTATKWYLKKNGLFGRCLNTYSK